MPLEFFRSCSRALYIYKSSGSPTCFSVISVILTYRSSFFLGLSGDGGTPSSQKLTLFIMRFFADNDSGAGVTLTLGPFSVDGI